MSCNLRQEDTTGDGNQLTGATHGLILHVTEMQLTEAAVFVMTRQLALPTHSFLLQEDSGGRKNMATLGHVLLVVPGRWKWAGRKVVET